MSGPNLQSVPSHRYDSYKAYSSTTGYSSQYKAYGSGAVSSEDAMWWRQATEAWMNHWSDIRNGVDPEQSQHILRPEDLQQLLAWMEGFAAERGIPFDPMAIGGSPLGGMMQPQSGAPGPVPNGASRGPEGYYYDSVESEIEFTGDPTRYDVESLKNVLKANSLGVNVTCEITSDGLTPPNSVLKVIVTNPRMGTTSVYYYHSWQSPDFELDIQVPDLNQVIIPAELAEIVKKSKIASTDEGDRPEFSIPGETRTEERDLDGDGVPETVEYTYHEAATMRDVHRIYPKPSSESRDARMVGNTNTSTSLAALTHIEPSDVEGFDWKMTITEDGETQVIYFKDDFKHNLNAVPGNVTFDVNRDGVVDELEEGEVPDELKEFFRINGAAASTTEETEALHEGDTVPDEILRDASDGHDGERVAIYNNSSDIQVTANFEDDVHRHRFYRPKNAYIKLDSYGNKVGLTYDPTAKLWTITIYKEYPTTDPDKIEVIEIQGGPETKVFLDVLGEENFVEDTSTDAINSVEIGSPTTAEEGEASTDLPPEIQGLVEATGKSIDEILDVLYSNFFLYGDLDSQDPNGDGTFSAAYDDNEDGKLSVEELKKAMREGVFPPVMINNELLGVLYAIDTRFKTAFDSVRMTDKQGLKIATQRLVTLLQILYPDATIEAMDPENSDWHHWNDINFNGIHFNYSTENLGTGDTESTRPILQYQTF